MAYTATDARKPFYNSSANSVEGQKFGVGTVPQIGGRVWYPVKLLHIYCNLFVRTEMLTLTVYEPIAIQILHGGLSPNFGGMGGVIGGRPWYPVKAHHNGHNLSI